MPCYDPTPDYVYDEMNVRREIALKDKVNMLTAMLCDLISNLRSYDDVFDVDFVLNKVSGLPQWLDKHNEADRERLACEEAERKRQAIKKSAIAKLTKDEKMVLGL